MKGSSGYNIIASGYIETVVVCFILFAIAGRFLSVFSLFLCPLCRRRSHLIHVAIRISIRYFIRFGRFFLPPLSVVSCKWWTATREIFCCQSTIAATIRPSDSETSGFAVVVVVVVQNSQFRVERCFGEICNFFSFLFSAQFSSGRRGYIFGDCLDTFEFCARHSAGHLVGIPSIAASWPQRGRTRPATLSAAPCSVCSEKNFFFPPSSVFSFCPYLR